MAISSIKVALMNSADGNSYSQVSSGTETLHIKSVPEIDPSGNPDQIETTDMMDTYHEFIDGLKNYLTDGLPFTANYSPALFSALQNLSAESYWAVWFGVDANGDPDGHNGKFSFTATCEVKLNSFGVGEITEMEITLKPKSDITFAVS